MHKWLLKSSLEKTPISIIYESKSRGFSKRTIIVRKLSTTHCFAYDFEKKEFRTFLINQILAIEPVQKKRTSPA